MDVLVRPTAGRADDEASLAIYNEVWPRVAISMDEVDSFKRSVLSWADRLAGASSPATRCEMNRSADSTPSSATARLQGAS